MSVSEHAIASTALVSSQSIFNFYQQISAISVRRRSAASVLGLLSLSLFLAMAAADAGSAQAAVPAGDARAVPAGDARAERDRSRSRSRLLAQVAAGAAAAVAATLFSVLHCNGSQW